MSEETRQRTEGNDECMSIYGIERPKPGASAKASITPEMRAIAAALANPEGDPYENGRKLGFYCEQCG